MNSGGLHVIYSCKCFIFNYASRWMKRFIDDPEAPHFDKKIRGPKYNELKKKKKTKSAHPLNNEQFQARSRSSHCSAEK